jgi:hypothetical protein
MYSLASQVPKTKFLRIGVFVKVPKHGFQAHVSKNRLPSKDCKNGFRSQVPKTEEVF